MHRGTSGAAVVMRDPSGDPKMPSNLHGVHSGRMDNLSRDQRVDESLGLNSAWYAEILLTLTVGDSRIPVPAELHNADLDADSWRRSRSSLAVPQKQRRRGCRAGPTRSASSSSAAAPTVCRSSVTSVSVAWRAAPA